MAPITDESAIAISFEMPGQPILVFYLSADDGGDDEVSFLKIESKLSPYRSGESWGWNF